MDASDLRKQIAASKATLEAYRSYGQFVVDAINDFTRLDEVLVDPSDENVAEGLEIVTKLNKQIGPYKVFIPQVANTVNGVLKWLRENK